MIKPLTRLSIIFTAIFALLSGLIAAQPTDDHAVLDFFACETQPCWRGIVPGVTLEDEAIPMLADDPTITRLTTANTYGFDKWYSWQWSDLYPADDPVIGVWQGGVYFDTKYGTGDIVDRLFLATMLRLGDLWALYAAPDEYLLLFGSSGTARLVNIDFRYGTMITMSAFTTCPITFGQALHQTTSLWVNQTMMPLQVVRPNTDATALRRAIIDANRRYC